MGGVKVHTRDFDREKIESLQKGLDFDDRDIGRALGSYPRHLWAQKRQFEYTL
jgi:molybdopterin/thiamine biosynthesis adenylyltransferase